jgi:hypothetical protein
MPLHAALMIAGTGDARSGSETTQSPLAFPLGLMGPRPVPRQHLRQPLQTNQKSHENAEVAALDAFAIAAGAKSGIFASGVNYACARPKGTQMTILRSERQDTRTSIDGQQFINLGDAGRRPRSFRRERSRIVAADLSG